MCFSLKLSVNLKFIMAPRLVSVSSHFQERQVAWTNSRGRSTPFPTLATEESARGRGEGPDGRINRQKQRLSTFVLRRKL